MATDIDTEQALTADTPQARETSLEFRAVRFLADFSANNDPQHVSDDNRALREGTLKSHSPGSGSIMNPTPPTETILPSIEEDDTKPWPRQRSKRKREEKEKEKKEGKGKRKEKEKKKKKKKKKHARNKGPKRARLDKTNEADKKHVQQDSMRVDWAKIFARVRGDN
ncbi:hypothetical protein E4U43_003094 [Claviceps pusilla]|uniref:Uncharacterized protein n=1 Tax=Claviceps pusilla TaxID=123648 RepID=A0A9P7N7Q3_9HYPO|nr:hypothetical protein E4U43_003094 [Claviceps pusilla]